MARAKPTVEATSQVVGRNLLRLRTERGLSLRSLSAQMPADHRLRMAAIGEIERAERRVTVDDLTALAVTLGVSPVALLMPSTLHASHPDVELTSVPPSPPATILLWLLGFGPLVGEGDQARVNLPPWAWRWSLDTSWTV